MTRQALLPNPPVAYSLPHRWVSENQHTRMEEAMPRRPQAAGLLCYEVFWTVARRQLSRVTVLAAFSLADDLSFTPRTYVVERDNRCPESVLWSPLPRSVYVCGCRYTHICVQEQIGSCC